MERHNTLTVVFVLLGGTKSEIPSKKLRGTLLASDGLTKAAGGKAEDGDRLDFLR